MPRIAALIVATTVCVGWLVRAESRGDTRAIWIAKPLASIGFVLTALAAGATSTTYGLAIIAALMLSLAGDVLLILKSDRAFLAGLASFLFGHVAFATAFFLHGVTWSVALSALASLAVLAAFVSRWLLPHVKGAMRPAVLAYITVITSMVSLSIAAVAAGGTYWIAVGALLFYASDLSVARDRFVAHGFVNRAWGLPAYYAAQLVLACTVLAR
jgi:uncharacterized membrane protein YhhN